MDDPVALLSALRGTVFGPVRFEDDADEARCDGASVSLDVDGPTVVARWAAPVGDVDVDAIGARASASPALIEVRVGDGLVEVRSWAGACSAGAVAVAVRAAVVVGGAPGGDDGAARRDAAVLASPSSGSVAPDAASQALPPAIDHGLELLAAACSPSLAEVLRALVLGEREQVTLARHQLDELTGAVLGSVTVFNVGTASSGGATVNLLLPSGRVVDVQVDVDDAGIRVAPETEGEEVLAALQLLDRALGDRGRHLARIAAAGDALVIATDLR